MPFVVKASEAMIVALINVIIIDIQLASFDPFKQVFPNKGLLLFYRVMGIGRDHLGDHPLLAHIFFRFSKYQYCQLIFSRKVLVASYISLELV